MPHRLAGVGRIDRAVERGLGAIHLGYERSLDVTLRHRGWVLLSTIATAALTVWLYGQVPKGFMPTQDTGLLQGVTVAGPEISFAAMAERQRRVVDVLLRDPAIAGVGSTIGVSALGSTSTPASSPLA